MGTGELITEADESGFWSVDGNVCEQHLRDPELLATLRKNLTEESCDFCARTGTAGAPIAARLDEIMPTIMVGIRALYEPASASGIDYMETELTTKYTDHEVVDDVIDADDKVRAAVAYRLTCDDWVQANWQRLRPDQEMFYVWEGFKSIIKHSLRFLFAGHPVNVDDQPSGARFLHDLIEMISAIDGLIVACPATLYRGRMFDIEPDIAKVGTAAQLGSPPHNRAAANRMSPAGISMFYGATDLDTAVAEIGAHSSYTHAVMGGFTPVRELRVLNLADLDKLPEPSLFNKSHHKAYFATEFLREFVADLTKPIELDGREHIDYVPTQVFTEYLKTAHPGRLDGLIFPSAQADTGSNVVIFCGPEQCVEKDSRHSTHVCLSTRRQLPNTA